MWLLLYVEKVANKYCARLYIIGSLYLDVSSQYPNTHSDSTA